MRNNKAMAAALVTLREDKGVTQLDVAVGTGIQPESISAYERGRRTPTLAKLQKLADYYGVSLDVITGREPAKK